MTRRAAITGVARLRQRPELDGPWNPREPADLMALAATEALTDARVQPADVDLLMVVPCLSWRYTDLADEVARRCDLGSGVASETAATGGTAPLDLLHEAVARIGTGDARTVLIVAAESMHSRRRARKEGVRLPWTPLTPKTDEPPFASDLERRHGLTMPIHVFPMLENAIRARTGRDVEAHQAVLGRLMARFASVAAGDGHAWFPIARSAEEITAVGERNRMVCFPYPKLMNSMLGVDLAAAVVVTVDSEGVQVAGGAGAEDPRFVSERRDYTSSPALRTAAAAALGHAGLDVADIDAFDLYSCFPSAVELALDALGLEAADPRSLTVTGGLPYAGGAGSGYALHSLAAMVATIRSGAAGTGLVTAVGMAAAAHVVTVLAAPGAAPASTGRAMRRTAVHRCDAPDVVGTMAGAATVEAYTVEYGRDAAPVRSILIVTDGSRRSVANGVDDQAFFAAFTEEEGVGRTGIVEPAPDGRNRFQLR